MTSVSDSSAKLAMQFESQRNYWSLVRELAAADFKLKYQGSVFGYLWSLMKPLTIFGVLYLVFSVFARFGADDPHFPIKLLLGVVLWNYFAESTSNGMRSIVDKGDLIRKVYFPRIVILLASSVSALITLGLNLIIIAVFLLLAGVEPTFLSLSFVLLVVEMYLLSLGISFILGALYVRYRDFAYIWEVLLQLMFYATPIVYPLTMVPLKIQQLLLLNPITQIIQDSRAVLVNHQTVTALGILPGILQFVPYLVPPLLVVAGYWYFERAASTFAEDV